MIEVIPKARYVKFQIGRRDLRRLVGLLDYVNLNAASDRFAHPYDQLASPDKDRDLIKRLKRAAKQGASDETRVRNKDQVDKGL